MKKSKAWLGVGLSPLLLASSAMAVDLSQISINGFGSVVGSMTMDEDEALYGADEDLSFQPESRFALQVSSPIGERWSATAQILARGEDNYDPSFEWAYVGYQATDNLKVLLGRQRFKIYKYSDYVDVGYAYPWIRPPQGVYSLPFSSGDGLGLVYTTYAGDMDITLGYSALGITIDDYIPSSTSNSAVTPAQLEVGISHVLNADFVYNDFNFGANFIVVPQLSYDIETANASVPTLITGLENAGVDQEIIDGLLIEEDSALSYGVYFGYDPGAWFLLAEYTKFDYDDTSFADQESMYVTLGARVDLWTFHVTYGQDENTAAFQADEVLPAAVAASPLGEGTQTLLDTQVEDSETWSVGVRYDIDTGIALKADFTTYDDDLVEEGEANLIAVGVDFVF